MENSVSKFSNWCKLFWKYIYLLCRTFTVNKYSSKAFFFMPYFVLYLLEHNPVQKPKLRFAITLPIVKLFGLHSFKVSLYALINFVYSCSNKIFCCLISSSNYVLEIQLHSVEWIALRKVTSSIDNSGYRACEILILFYSVLIQLLLCHFHFE